MSKGILFALFFALGSTLGRAADAPTQPLTVADLIGEPEKYLDRIVEIDLVEPLFGPSTEEKLAQTEYGQIVVGTPRYSNFNLVPAAFRLSDPDRYRRKFDRVLESPLRIRGELLNDQEIAASNHRPYALVLRVVSLQPLALPEAEPLHSLEEVKADPKHWDRKRVVYEGMYDSRFEVSALDRAMWLSFARNAQVVGAKEEAPGSPRTPHRVRVTGILFGGGFFGHLGHYRCELVASKIEYLD